MLSIVTLPILIILGFISSLPVIVFTVIYIINNKLFKKILVTKPTNNQFELHLLINGIQNSATLSFENNTTVTKISYEKYISTIEDQIAWNTFIMGLNSNETQIMKFKHLSDAKVVNTEHYYREYKLVNISKDDTGTSIAFLVSETADIDDVYASIKKIQELRSELPSVPRRANIGTFIIFKNLTYEKIKQQYNYLVAEKYITKVAKKLVKIASNLHQDLYYVSNNIFALYYNEVLPKVTIKTIIAKINYRRLFSRIKIQEMSFDESYRFGVINYGRFNYDFPSLMLQARELMEDKTVSANHSVLYYDEERFAASEEHKNELLSIKNSIDFFNYTIEYSPIFAPSTFQSYGYRLHLENNSYSSKTVETFIAETNYQKQYCEVVIKAVLLDFYKKSISRPNTSLFIEISFDQIEYCLKIIKSNVDFMDLKIIFVLIDYETINKSPAKELKLQKIISNLAETTKIDIFLKCDTNVLSISLSSLNTFDGYIIDKTLLDLIHSRKTYDLSSLIKKLKKNIYCFDVNIRSVLNLLQNLSFTVFEGKVIKEKSTNLEFVTHDDIL